MERIYIFIILDKWLISIGSQQDDEYSVSLPQRIRSLIHR